MGGLTRGIKYSMLTSIPNSFKEGCRLILLLERNKEGGRGSERNRSKRKISNTIEEYDAIVSEFIAEATLSDVPLRVYASVNTRDRDKGIREFKRQQLDADYYDNESKYSFYNDCRNRWIGSLMKHSSRGTAFFLIDCDTQEEKIDAERQLSERNIVPVFSYPTKNGQHIITQPFNPNGFSIGDSGSKINVDGLLLLYWKD